MMTIWEQYPFLSPLNPGIVISAIFFAGGFITLVVSYFFFRKNKRHKKNHCSPSFPSQLLENIPDAVCFKDIAGKFIYANKTYLQTTNAKVESKLIGKTVFDVFSEKYANQYHDDEIEILEGKKDILVRNESGLDSEGYEIPLLSYKVALKNDEGETIGLAEISRDITHWKQLERDMIVITDDLNDSNRLLTQRQKEIEKLNATKDRLLSIIAHDLKNPFNSIIGLSDILLLKLEKFQKKDLEELIGMINIASKSAYGLLENLLDWGRSQTETVIFSPQQIPVKELVQEIITLLTIQANKKDIRFINKTENGDTIRADRNMLQTVIRNIATNAVKYTNSDGTITFAYRKEKRYNTLSISDTGVGIPEDKIESMFNLDEIESTTGTSGESGTGLGLIVCAEFMQKHRGEISVESKLGEGSVFHLKFPAQ